MLSLPSSVRIFLAREPTDMRKGFDGLAALVRRQGGEVFSGHLFAFVSKRRDRIKILVWDNGGFVLYYKRLEKSRFQLPRCGPDAHCVQLDSAQLAMLLDGIDVSVVRRPAKWLPPNLERRGIDIGDHL
jgi:transposase